jgi:hypothetical protein
MSNKKAKIYLINNDLTVAAIARRIEPNATESRQASLRVMITDMINGRRFYPSLAQKVNDAVGLRLERPRHLIPFATRQAA